MSEHEPREYAGELRYSTAGVSICLVDMRGDGSERIELEGIECKAVEYVADLIDEYHELGQRTNDETDKLYPLYVRRMKNKAIQACAVAKAVGELILGMSRDDVLDLASAAVVRRAIDRVEDC